MLLTIFGKATVRCIYWATIICFIYAFEKDRTINFILSFALFSFESTFF